MNWSLRLGVILLAVLWLMWLIVTVVVGERVIADAVDFHVFQDACKLPGQDSVTGETSWSWWPPGEVCRDRYGHVLWAPLGWRGPAAVIAGSGWSVLAAATFWLAYRHRTHN